MYNNSFLGINDKYHCIDIKLSTYYNRYLIHAWNYLIVSKTKWFQSIEKLTSIEISCIWFFYFFAPSPFETLNHWHGSLSPSFWIIWRVQNESLKTNSKQGFSRTPQLLCLTFVCGTLATKNEIHMDYGFFFFCGWERGGGGIQAIVYLVSFN